MYGKIKKHLQEELASIESAGLYKSERIIATSQDAVIKLTDGSEVINFCANNYLGLSNNSRVCEAAKKTLDTHGFGMSSVRFICGTQDIHKELEQTIADFHQTEDTILYAAAFDANGGVFEPLLGPDDAIISDSLNHASIIDGVRLCKAKRFRYKNNNLVDLETQLIAANEAGSRFKIIVTDGVFSMDGYVAEIGLICDLADKYDALVMVDECHANGFIGKTGIGRGEAGGSVQHLTSSTPHWLKVPRERSILEVYSSEFEKFLVIVVIACLRSEVSRLQAVQSEVTGPHPDRAEATRRAVFVLFC